MKKIFFLLLVATTILFAGCKKKLNCGDVVTPVVTSNSPVQEQGNLQLLATSSEPDLLYTWTGPNNFSSTEQNPVLPYVTYDAAGTYKLQMFSGGCPAAEVSTDVSIVPATPPCTVPVNTLNYANCFFDQTYSACYAGLSSGHYRLTAGNASSDMYLTFNTSAEPPLGLYTIEGYPCNNCGTGYVELRLLASGSVLTIPDGGTLYLQKTAGKITATFCDLKVSHSGCTATVNGKFKAN